MIKHLLIVCTGNTCRSPMAEGYVNAVAASRGLPIEAKSAGIDVSNSPAADNAIAAMKELHIDISAHRSTRLTASMVNWADVILCMTTSHKTILTMAGIDEKKIQVLGSGIPDPYGGNLDLYRATRDALIKQLDVFIPSICIKPMTADYAPILSELDEMCIEEPWSEQGFLAELEKDTSVFRIAEDVNGNILGFCGTYIVCEDADIAQIVVAPDARRQKVGTWLLEDAIGQAKKKGATVLHLDVREGNMAARSLYESMGFVQDGKRAGFYAHPKEDAILYSLSLKEEES